MGNPTWQPDDEVRAPPNKDEFDADESRYYQMVEATVSALMAHIDNPNAATPRRETIDGPLIVRGSARKPEGWLDEGV